MRPRRVSEVDTDIMHGYIPQGYIHDNPCSKPRRSWRHTAPTTVTPARAARSAAATTVLNPHPHPHPRTHTRGTAYAGMLTRKRRSDPQRKLLTIHARDCVVGRSQPTPANSQLLPIGTDRRLSTTHAARAVTLARARKTPRPPNRESPSLDLSGTVRISRWRSVACLRPQLANWHR